MNKSVLRSYIIGYIGSLILTFAAFIPVYLYQTGNQHFLEQTYLVVLILILAFIQVIVQLVFFLHLGRESSPKFNLIFLLLTVGMIVTVMVGSIWIMNNLNYHMTPTEMEKYIIEDELLHD